MRESELFKLPPDLEGLKSFTHDEAIYDSLVRKSIEAGFMTEGDLVVGR